MFCLSQASVLQNLRSAMRRQIRRHSSRRSSSRRRLGRLWNRLFHRGSRLRGQIPLLTPPGHTHPDLSLHSYNTTDDGIEESCESAGQTPPPCSTVALGLALQAHTEALCLPDRESPSSPLSLPSPNSPRSTSDTLEDEEDEDDTSLEGIRMRSKQGIYLKNKDDDSPPGPPDSPKRSTSRSRSSRRLVQELAAELRGVSLLRYTSVGISALSSPESPTSSSGQSEEQRSFTTFRKPHMDAHTDSLTDAHGHARKSSVTEEVPGDSVRLCRLTTSEEEDDEILLVH